MAKQFGYYDDWKTETLECPKCGWRGTFEEGSVEYHSELMDCSCPKCDWSDAPMLAIVSYPTIGESRANWDKLAEEEKESVRKRESFIEEFDSRKLRSSTALPDISESSFVLHWDFCQTDQALETVIRHGDHIIFREPALYEGYERFIEVARILRNRYGPLLTDLIPTDRSKTYLYGDRISSIETVEEARKQIFGGVPVNRRRAR